MNKLLGAIISTGLLFLMGGSSKQWEGTQLEYLFEFMIFSALIIGAIAIGVAVALFFEQNDNPHS